MSLCVASGCSGPEEIETIWPPADFRLVVEELQRTPTEELVVKRFRAGHDRYCVFGLATGEPVRDPESGTSVPVFRTLCAYRMNPEATRLLSRRLYSRGVLGLGAEQGDGRDTDGVSLRISFRAFGQVRDVVVRGQVHGQILGVLAAVNAFLPPGQQFRLPSMSTAREPSKLSGVPEPREDPGAALAGYRELLEQKGDDGELVLDAFALACSLGDRSGAADLLERWTRLRAEPAAQGPFVDPPRLTRDMLARMLPP